ncbi:hypothetical protein [Paenibacillus amylolyticus]|nr:hypothetical protein [Paenibacillus amylolyticus]
MNDDTTTEETITITVYSSQEADQASTSVVRKGSYSITQIRNQP